MTHKSKRMNEGMKISYNNNKSKGIDPLFGASYNIRAHYCSNRPNDSALALASVLFPFNFVVRLNCVARCVLQLGFYLGMVIEYEMMIINIDCESKPCPCRRSRYVD